MILESRVIDISHTGSGSRDRKEVGGEGKGMETGIKMCDVHVPTSHKECKYYALQIYTNKK